MTVSGELDVIVIRKDTAAAAVAIVPSVHSNAPAGLPEEDDLITLNKPPNILIIYIK